MARITLEDLDGLGEEAEDGGGEEEEEEGGGEEGEEERGRLFAHWEAVASTHRVSLPRGERRAGPAARAGPCGGPGSLPGAGGAYRGWPGRARCASGHPFLCPPAGASVASPLFSSRVLCLADMAGPIAQMNRHRQAREPVPYVTLSRREKVRPRSSPRPRALPSRAWPRRGPGSQRNVSPAAEAAVARMAAPGLLPR